MLEYAHKTIDQTRKVVKELCGKNKITSERYVMNKPKQLLHDIIGRIDYETNNGLFYSMDPVNTLKDLLNE